MTMEDLAWERLLDACITQHATSNSTDTKELPLYDAIFSWQAIFLSFTLTLLQVVFFLTIFECYRRSEKVGSVYDRRRPTFPTRTPPPLMQNRGLLWGYLAFEWYRLKVADDAYRRRSAQEHRERREKAELLKAKNSKRKAQKPVDDEYLRKAEQMCYEQSPFYDPDARRPEEMADDANTEPTSGVSSDTVEGSYPVQGGFGRSLEGQSNEEKHRGPGITIKFMNQSMNNQDNSDRALGDDGLDDSPTRTTLQIATPDAQDLAHQFVSDEDGNCDDNDKNLKPPSKELTRSLFRPSGILRSRSAPLARSAPILQGNQPRNVDFGMHTKSSSSRDPPVPFTVGKSLMVPEGSSVRKVRFSATAEPARLGDSGSNGSPQLGSEDAARLAALRLESHKNGGYWRSHSSSLSGSVTSYVKHRILMMRDEEPTRPPSFDNSDPDLARGHASEYVADKVWRRPLNVEQQELLRCIGLDSFMTLRFLKFGFDVSFWPFLLSLVSLVPLYRLSAGNIVGFYSVTVVALDDGATGYWLVMAFGILQFTYMLRRLWIEWELFLPLRYDFLENGDFQKEKYKEQYQMTCVVEYVPTSLKHDKDLYAFFDAIFPGQVRRAEVLLNTEYLSSLIQERLKCIELFENMYAKKVHLRAQFMRNMDKYMRTGILLKWYRLGGILIEPSDPEIWVVHEVPVEIESTDVWRFNPYTQIAKDPRRHKAMDWYHERIQTLNKQIEDEYLRLAQEQRRPAHVIKESLFAKWVGLKYLTGSDTERVHSRTAFVEFRSLAAKQEAIQCNITGTSNLVDVTPVPEIRDIIWENAHVSRSFIETRKGWANLVLVGGLICWSLLVSFIRQHDDLSSDLLWKIAEISAVQVFIDTYLPILVVEGLVRIVPFALKALCVWIRFKSNSEVDHYVLKWYFGYRLITFVFVILAGSLIKSSDKFVTDPLQFLKDLSRNVAANSQFFMSYVMVTGGIQIFFRLSQIHNLVLYWFIQKIITEEAISQRRLDKIKTSLKIFHLDEFIPLFIFIFMVGALYGSLAPLSGLVVAGFFHLAYKVFKYMTLFVYGNNYQGGGFLFYTLSEMIFTVTYMIILILAGNLSLHSSTATAGIFSLLLFITAFVHVLVHKTFVVPSRTLALSKARDFDERRDVRTMRQRKLDAYLIAKRELELAEEAERRASHGGEKAPGDGKEQDVDVSSNMGDVDDDEDQEEEDDDDDDIDFRRRSRHADPWEKSLADESLTESERQRLAVSRLERRYVEDDDAISDFTTSEDWGPASDFFTYRQPSLNRVTWEFAPRPYRQKNQREEGQVMFWH